MDFEGIEHYIDLEWSFVLRGLSYTDKGNGEFDSKVIVLPTNGTDPDLYPG